MANPALHPAKQRATIATLLRAGYGHWLAVACCAVLLLAYGLTPYAWFWHWAYEHPRLHIFGGLILVALAMLFYATGFWQHMTGRCSQAMPLVALITTLALFTLTCTWLFRTAPYQSRWATPIVLVSLAMLSALLVESLSAYTGWWHSWGEHLRKRIYAEIESGKLRKDIVARRARWPENPWGDGEVTSSAAATTWREQCAAAWRRWQQQGSWHCLTVIEGYYDECRREVLREVQSETPPPSFAAYLEAGECLANYLCLPFAAAEPTEEQRRWHIAEVRREMITLQLWFARTVSDMAPLELHEFQTKIARWIYDKPGQEPSRSSAFYSVVPASHAAYAQLMRGILLPLGFPSCVELTKDKKVFQPREYDDMIVHILTEFDDVRALPSPHRVALTDACIATWLALTTRLSLTNDSKQVAVVDSIRFDVWMALRQRAGVGLELQELCKPHTDPAFACASVALAEVYERWQERLPGDWESGMRQRHERFRQRANGYSQHAIAALLQTQHSGAGR